MYLDDVLMMNAILIRFLTNAHKNYFITNFVIKHSFTFYSRVEKISHRRSIFKLPTFLSFDSHLSSSGSVFLAFGIQHSAISCTRLLLPSLFVVLRVFVDYRAACNS